MRVVVSDLVQAFTFVSLPVNIPNLHSYLFMTIFIIFTFYLIYFLIHKLIRLYPATRERDFYPTHRHTVAALILREVGRVRLIQFLFLFEYFVSLLF